MKEIVWFPQNYKVLHLVSSWKWGVKPGKNATFCLTKPCYYRFENLLFSAGEVVNDVNCFVASPVRLKVMLHDTILNGDF